MFLVFRYNFMYFFNHTYFYTYFQIYVFSFLSQCSHHPLSFLYLNLKFIFAPRLLQILYYESDWQLLILLKLKFFVRTKKKSKSDFWSNGSLNSVMRPTHLTETHLRSKNKNKLIFSEISKTSKRTSLNKLFVLIV